MNPVTAWIKIEKTATGYKVELRSREQEPWDQAKLLASEEIPKDLATPNRPEDPSNQLPLTPKGLCSYLLNQDRENLFFTSAGIWLYRIAFPGSVGKKWQELNQEAGLRTWLDVQADELAALPWELTYDPDDETHLFTYAQNPIFRGNPTELLPAVDNKPGPIRFLIVVGSPNDNNIQDVEELEQLVQILRGLGKKVDWEILKAPTRIEHAKQIRSFVPHVYHFIGHGGVNANGMAVLEFSGSENWQLTKGEIGELLRSWTPRFVFLNACRSAALASQSSNRTLAEAFLRKKVPAVLGMQANIRSNAAVCCAEKLYLALARGLALDSAMAEARRAMSLIPGLSYNHRDCFLPSLSFRIDPELVLPPARIDNPQNTIASEFHPISSFFINRNRERRELWYGVSQLEENGQPQSLWVVKSESPPNTIDKPGATWLVQWCLEAFVQQGHQATYVDLAYEPTDFPTLLKIVQQGNPGAKILPSLQKPLNPQHFSDFEQQFIKVGVSNSRGSEIDNPFESLAKSFLNGLKKTVGTGKMILVLDHLQLVQPQFDYLWELICKPVGADPTGSLQIILVFSNREYLIHNMKTRLTRKPIEVNSLSGEYFQELALRYFRSYKIVNEEKVQILIGATREDKWYPNRLKSIANLLMGGGHIQ